MVTRKQQKLAKYNLVDQVENEVRLARPQLGMKADHKGSRTAAIHVFCISCMGGSRNDVKGCTSYVCPLWQYRPGRTKGELPPGVPTQEQYQELIDKSVTPAQREAGRRLAKRNEE